MATEARADEQGEKMRAAMGQMKRACDLLAPLFAAATKAMEDFGEAVRRDPQLARLIEEHARIQGLDRG